MCRKFSSFLSILSCLFLSSALFAQNVAINTSGNAAYTGAILDLSDHNTAGTNGFLAPYITLTDATTLSPVVGAGGQLSGLMVYNTSASLLNGLSGPGLYYWNNTLGTPQWIFLGGSSVNSITGTAPVIVTPTTGTPVISLQGTAGGIFYGTGAGSNVTAAGTSGQYLMSNGAAAPTWQTIYVTGGQTHTDYSSLFTSTTSAGTEFSTTSAAFVNVTGATITIAQAGTYIITASADCYFGGGTFGGEITLTNGANYWGTSAPYVTTYWQAWSTQAVVTIAGATTYNIQLAAHLAVTCWVRNATITAIKVN